MANPLTIGIDATCWSNPRGYGRFARGLLSALITPDSPHKFILFIDQQSAQTAELPASAMVEVVKTTVAPTEAATASGNRSVRDMWKLTRAVSRYPLDIMFFPSVYTYFPVLNRTRIIVGIHDAIAERHRDLLFPDWRPWLFWSAKTWLARRQADAIMTVSDYARDTLVDYFDLSPAKIHVVGEAPDAIFQPKTPAEYAPILETHHLSISNPYFVCLGGLNPHKNIPLLIEAFAAVQRDYPLIKLLLIGPSETDTFSPGTAEVQSAIEKFGLEKSVVFTGYLPDETVVGLLNGARALVMPSLEEGYGLGAIEAAACGTPVIATCHSPLPQLLADGGIFIDPHDLPAMMQALNTFVSNPQDAMATTALMKANDLAWAKSAEQFLKMLETL